MGKCLFMRKGAVHTAPSAGILASDLAVGSTVKLMENGVAAEYLVVNQGIPSDSTLYDASCNGTWLLRKDIHSTRVWDSTNNDYANSDIHAWLNGTFVGLFDFIAQNAIRQVKIPYHNGTGTSGSIASGANGLQTRIFLLGGYELGWTRTNHSSFPIDGACLSYFSDIVEMETSSKRIAYHNGAALQWFLRSPYLTNTAAVHTVYSSGKNSNAYATGAQGIRPALILPSNALFDAETLILKGVS